MPMGVGYLAAADRLDLIYLADPVAMGNLLSQFAEQAIHLKADHTANLLKRRQFEKALKELAGHLAEILRGENPRFMAIPWFTDPAQLRKEILKEHAEAYAGFSEEDKARLHADPIAEEAWLFIGFVVDSDSDEKPEELATAINNYTRAILGIPSVVPLPVQYLATERKVVTAVRIPQGESISTSDPRKT